ncbi:MAG TPA: ABC transporter permease subunit [Streptosporangiaceae bacterium]
MTALTAARGRHPERTRPGWAGMIWVAWRQQRVALACAGGLLGALALLLGVTGLRMQSAHGRLASRHCAAGALLTSRCGRLQDAFYHAGYPLTGNVSLLVICLAVLPGLVGVFAGAPLIARELESGTYRFAWTQAASRTRWILAKLALPGAALAVAAALFGSLASWWLLLADQLPAVGGSRWQFGQFGQTAVTFTGWVLLAFAAGVFAGSAIRRTVPAMAVTAAAVGALTGATYWKLNGLLTGLAPVTQRGRLAPYTSQSGLANSVPLTPGGGLVATPRGSWPVNVWLTTAQGHPVSFSSPRLYPLWMLKEPAQPGWLGRHHLALWVSYEPGGRFWAFQAIEGGGCLLLALILAAVTVWLVRRRAA